MDMFLYDKFGWVNVSLYVSRVGYRGSTQQNDVVGATYRVSGRDGSPSRPRPGSQRRLRNLIIDSLGGRLLTMTLFSRCGRLGEPSLPARMLRPFVKLRPGSCPASSL